MSPLPTDKGQRDKEAPLLLSRRRFCQGAAGMGALAALARMAGMGALAGVTAAFAPLSGCVTGPSPKSRDLEVLADANTGEAFWFIDSAGRKVALSQDITKVSPSGAYAQIMLSTLCPDKLCSLSSRFSTTQAHYLGERLAALPELGRFYGRSADLNHEEMIHTNPDVIVDVGEEKTNIANDLDGLQTQTGLPVIFVDATFERMADAYRMLGQALGVVDEAEALASYMDETFAFAAAHKAEVAARGLRLLYSGGEYGLDVVARGSVHSGAIDALGVDNVAVLGETNSTLVSIETVMLWAPDVVLLSPLEGYFLDIYEDEIWQSVPAVMHKRVYEVPAKPYEWLNKPPSVQTALGLRWLGNLLYPDIYDFDIIAEAQRFYKLFWHYELSAAEARELMGNSTYLERR